MQELSKDVSENRESEEELIVREKTCDYEGIFKLARKLNTPKAFDMHDEIMKVLKKERLTYREAYAALELLYLTLKHESEFANLHQ